MTKRGVIITTSVLVGITMIFTILFGVIFCAWNINVVYQGECEYVDQTAEILTASKLKKGSSIFSIDRAQIENNIETSYPDLKAKVNLTGFNSVRITISTRTPLYYFVQEGVYYVLDEDCKVLEVTNNSFVANKYIKLENNFSASESLTAGQFVGGRYASICTDLFKAMYMYLGEDLDNDGVLDNESITRDDMRGMIASIKFGKDYDLYGAVDQITLTTTDGVKINIVQPQLDLGLKANKAFSAFRQLTSMDRTGGNINVIYAYDQNNNQSIVCEYRR